MTAAATHASAHDAAGVIHVHSSYSHDGRDTPERLHDWAAERGIAFIGLTDHAEDLSPEVWPEYVARCQAASSERVRIIPGLEFRFQGYTGLHLLALALERWIEPATPGEFVAATRGAARLTIVAHPVLARWRIPDEVRAGIDAVEVWNASYNTRYLPDPRSIRVLHEIRRTRPEVVGTVGLDQHDCRNDRETRVLVASGTEDPITELRAGRFSNLGRTMRFDPAAAMGPARLGLLSTARWAFDRVERAQERVTRALRGSRAS
ncbi:MAG TPA: PHP domain-containing protein [Gemmatimonadaceae bacterium]|nr:PHP domain-containing protein [Gemmatimonadaceae bacterium]